MERLVTVSQYGVGTTEYTREIDLGTFHRTNNRDIRKSWAEMTDEERQESSYRSNVSHTRARMITRAKSAQYLFHAVFTTTDNCLRRDIKRFSQIVAQELESQGINHFMFYELNHKQEIWHYDDDNFDARQIITDHGYTCYPKDSVENAFGCYNRRAFAPLADNNDMHIHVLTDKPVSFINYVKNVECNPNNLYCELFYNLYEYVYYSSNHSLEALEHIKEIAQHKNIRYMSKLAFYTKSKLPKYMQLYKTNNKKVEHLKQTFILNEYGEILFTLRNDFDFSNLENVRKEERNQERIEINSFDFEKSDYYKNLNDIDKHNFQINYIKNLVEVNKFYRNELIFYKKELDFLDKPFTFTNFKSESVLNLKSILDFDTTKFVNKYNQTYYTSTNNNTLTNKSNGLGAHSHTPVHPNTPVVYSLVCLFTSPVLFVVPVLFTTPVFFLLCSFSGLEKSVTYKYRPNISGAKIYVLKVKNRLSCKRFRRKRRRLQVKKPSKIKFN